MQFSIKTKLKRIVSATLASLLMLTSTPMVSAANGWDEAEHKRWVTCTTCGGAGSRVVGCSTGSYVSCSPGYNDTSECGSCRGSGSTTCPGDGQGGGSGGGCAEHGYAGSGCGASISCSSCGGDGSSSGWVTCSQCSGSGSRWQSCVVCGGTGSRVVSCSTGSYQYDTAAPTLSATKSIDAHDPAYAGQAVTVTATATDSLSGVYQYKFDDAPWQSSNTTVVPNTAGAITVKVQVKDSAGNISATTIDVKTIQNQSPLTITQPVNPTYGTAFTLSATGGTTGNPVTWEVAGGATITANGVVSGHGEVTVTATMPGNSLYYDAVATMKITIQPKEIISTGTVTVDDKTYDGATSSVASSSLSLIGVVGSDDVSIGNITANFDTAHVGNSKAVTLSPLTLSGSTAARYSLLQPTLTGYTANVTAKPLTVSDTAVSNKIYDANTSAAYTTPPQLVGIVGADDVALQVGTPNFDNENMGIDKQILLSPFALIGGGISNYTLVQPTPGTANIVAKEVTVTDVTVDDKTYDGATSATYKSPPQLVGVIGSDDVIIVNGTPNFDDKNVGKDKVVSYSAFTLSGAQANNYAVVQPSNTTASVAKKDITVSPLKIADKEYDATTVGDFAEIPSLVGAVSGDDITLKNGDITFDNENVATGKAAAVTEFSVSGADVKNYNFTQPVLNGHTAAITKKTVTIMPKSHSKVFGVVDPKLEYTHSALIGADVVTGELARASGEDAGEYGYTLGTLSASDNYTLKLDNTKFAIKKATGSVTIAVNKSTSAPIDVTLSAAVSGTDGAVEFYILGEKVNTAKVKNGIATAVYKPQSAGNYYATAKLVSSKNYSDTVSERIDFTVSIAEIYQPSPPDKPKHPSSSRPSSKPTSSATSKPTSSSASGSSETVDVASAAVLAETTGTSVAPEIDPFWENTVTQEENDKIPPTNEPNLIVVDVTEGVDLTEYTALLPEADKDKLVVGVYSAKLLLDGAEIELNEVVEVNLPIAGKLAEFTDHGVLELKDGLSHVDVKSATAQAITFDTNSLGYFAVVGTPVGHDVPLVKSGFNWAACISFTLALLLLAGLSWWFFFIFWKRKKEKEDEE